MISTIKNKLKSDNNKRLLSNFFSLFILQGTNYILPLILFPYLVHVLGIEKFGLLAFATATVAFFRSFTAYGFDLSGTKEISINRDNQKNVNDIFNSILFSKLILFFLSLIVFSLMITLIEKISVNKEVFIFSFIIILGDVLFPVWFFQGIERMKFITYFRLTYKVIVTILTFLLVKEESDIFLVPLIDGLGAIIMGFFTILYINKKFNIKLSLPNLQSIKLQLENGWHIFISNIAVLFYTSLNTFLLGILTNNLYVGYYSVAEKIYMAVRGLFGPVLQVLFPFLSKKYIDDKNRYYEIVKKMVFIFFSMLVLFSIILYFSSSILVDLVSRENNIETISLLKVFSISLVFALGGLFSNLLIIKGEGKILSSITFKSMLVNLLLIYPAILYFNIFGMVYVFLIVQVFQTYLQVKNNIEVFNKKALND